METINRNGKVDNLRFIGILLIILAHCGAPIIINNIRCFDVILMVFISSYIHKDIENITAKSYVLYVKKKAKRLLLPTYIFIVFFSVILFCGYRILGRADLFGLKQFCNSLLLCENSVGYVWIMKVYFVNALINPLIVRFQKTLKNSKQFIVILGIQYFVYFIIVYFYNYTHAGNNYVLWVVINEWVMCCFPYSLVSQVALWYKHSKSWQNNGLYIWGAIFLITVITSSGINTVAGKRPANLQYLSWGLLMTEILFKTIPDKNYKLCEWVSRNSMDIYLAHPVFIVGFDMIKKLIHFNISIFWYIEWIIVVVCSSLVVYKKNKLFAR